ncbi:MAG: hypothetical protein MHM6MM_003808 [Cercozoa sp. M6MM]
MLGTGFDPASEQFVYAGEGQVAAAKVVTLGGFLGRVAAVAVVSLLTGLAANALNRLLSQRARDKKWQQLLKKRFFGAPSNPTIFSQYGPDTVLATLEPEERRRVMAQVLMPASGMWLPGSSAIKLPPESASNVGKDNVESFQSLWSQLLNCEHSSMLQELRQICRVQSNSQLKFRLGTLYTQSLRDVTDTLTQAAEFELSLRLLAHALTTAPSMLHLMLGIMPKQPRVRSTRLLQVVLLRMSDTAEIASIHGPWRLMQTLPPTVACWIIRPAATDMRPPFTGSTHWERSAKLECAATLAVSCARCARADRTIAEQ